MASIKNSFGLGGGTSKTRLVADLNDEYKKLNATLKETDKLSKSIAGSLKNSGGRRGGGGASSMSEPTEPPEPPEPGEPGGSRRTRAGGSSGSTASSYGSALKSMAGSAVTALATGIDTENYITNDIARRRFGFFSGVYSRQNDNIGTIAGMKAFASMSSRGTPTSAMDAANATMAGNSMGLMSGLKNYNTIINSTAGISNVMPGVGLEGGMGAVSALNQGSSINKLRMIGIQVRDSNGYMRNVEDIARDLWNTLNRSKSGPGKITESDLSYSLQAGNSVAMLLDQYFGTDAVLKQSIVAYLFQFAKNNGAKVGGGYQTEAGKKELLTTGANPGITQSIGMRNKTGQENISAYTSAGVLGIQFANDIIINLTALATKIMPLMEGLVTTTTTAQTLGGAGNGAGGILIKDALDSAKGGYDVAATAGKALLKSPTALATIAAAIGIAGLVRHSTQINDEKWAAQIASGERTPYDKGPGIMDDVDPATVAGINARGSGYRPSTGVGIYKMNDTQDGWSKKLLSRLGAPVSPGNLAAIKEWMQHENTSSSNYLGERNSPLNMGYDITGTSVGKDQWGRSVYATEDQGLDATAKFLTSSTGHGYENIVNLLKSGRATETEIWSAIAASDWSGTNYGVKGGSTSYNGATININIPNAGNMDPVQLANAIREVLTAEELKNQAQGGGRR